MTDIHPTLRFADRTDAEIGRLVRAAFGGDVDMSLSAADQLEATIGLCSATSVDSSTLEVQGGCGYLGTSFAGQVMVTKVRPWLDDVVLDNLEVRSATSDSTYAGQVRGAWMRYEPQFRLDYPCQFDDVDLTVDLDGLAVRSDLALSCEDDPSGVQCSDTCEELCTLQGSGLELVGGGGVLVSGRWYYREMEAPCIQVFDRADKLELRGYDLVTATVTSATPLSFCFEWTLEGTDRTGTGC